MTDNGETTQVDQILQMPHLADALEGDQFRQFLDHVPFAIAVSNLQGDESIIYANLQFEHLSGLKVADVQGKPWTILDARSTIEGEPNLCQAIVTAEEYIGTYAVATASNALVVDAWSNTIINDDGMPIFRLVALAEINNHDQAESENFREKLQEKDTLLRELQHRVKNNLQMITALIRLETRNLEDDTTAVRFDRLAGRVNSLALLYRSLNDEGDSESVDLGVYLSQIASAVMSAHAVEGIRLDLLVDTWPVSVNVAMPAGLVVNELLTNALKHAFVGRDGGTITLRSLVDDTGCHITIGDDGVGLKDGDEWPKRGKLSALIVQSLQQNAKAKINVESKPGEGLRVTLFFARAAAAPDAQSAL